MQKKVINTNKYANTKIVSTNNNTDRYNLDPGTDGKVSTEEGDISGGSVSVMKQVAAYHNIILQHY